MKVRRRISDEEFRTALYGRPGDVASVTAAADNRNVMESTALRFRNHLDAEAQWQCALAGLWHCLQGHDPKYGQKFTTSLYRHVCWECIRQIRIDARAQRRQTQSIVHYDFPEQSTQDPNESTDIENVREHLAYLSKESRDIVYQTYFERCTLDEVAQNLHCSKQSVRHKLADALTRLHELCSETAESV